MARAADPEDLDEFEAIARLRVPAFELQALQGGTVHMYVYIPKNTYTYVWVSDNMPRHTHVHAHAPACTARNKE